MPELTYIFRFRTVKAGEIPTTGGKPKTRADSPDSYHHGFRVEGHRPGELERCREHMVAAHEAWWKLPQEQQRKLRAQGTKDPKPWDEDSWRRRAPRHMIKRLDLLEAAQLAAEIATKLGWTEVRVVELKKGEAEAGFL